MWLSFWISYSLIFLYITNMGCGSSQVFLLYHLRKNSKIMEFYPNLISSSFLVALEVGKERRLKTSSEITDFFIFLLVTFCVSNDKKEVKTLKWLKISSNKESFFHPLWSWNYWKNASLFMETDDIYLTVFHEILKTCKSFKNSFQNTLLSEASSTLNVLIKF